MGEGGAGGEDDLIIGCPGWMAGQVKPEYCRAFSRPVALPLGSRPTKADRTGHFPLLSHCPCQARIIQHQFDVRFQASPFGQGFHFGQQEGREVFAFDAFGVGFAEGAADGAVDVVVVQFVFGGMGLADYKSGRCIKTAP